MPTNRLILLSDLWGQRQSYWWPYYTQALAPHFNLKWYDSCALGGITLEPYTQDALHQQFVGGGIEQAVTELIRQEAAYTTPPIVLSFSVGGAIAWNAVRAGLSVEYFFAISATRLRYEGTPLNINGELLYGAADPFLPTAAWMQAQSLSCQLLPGQQHDCYQLVDTAEMVAERLRSII